MMQQSNPNEIINWRNKLDMLEAAPAAHSWELLNARLVHAEPTKKPFWYWLAAAAVIGSIVLIFSLFGKKQAPPSVVQNHEKQIIFTVPDLVVKNSTGIRKTQPRRTLKKTKIHLRTVPAETVSAPVSVISPEIAPLVLTSPAITPAMPVIHINELDKRARQKESFARNADENDRPHRMTLSNNASDDIIKINLSPTN